MPERVKRALGLLTSIGKDKAESVVQLASHVPTAVPTVSTSLPWLGARLASRVSRWYPGLPQAATITISHLLRHTAGLPDYGRLPAYHAAVRRTPSRPWTFQKFAAQTYAKGLWFPPGAAVRASRLRRVKPDEEW